MEFAFKGTQEELETLVLCLGIEEPCTCCDEEEELPCGQPEFDKVIEDLKEMKHFSVSKSTNFKIKDMSDFYIVACIHQLLDHDKVGDLLENDEFRALILTLAAHVEDMVSEELMPF